METSPNESADVGDVLDKPSNVNDVDLNAEKISRKEMDEFSAGIESIDIDHISEKTAESAENINDAVDTQKENEAMETDEPEISTNGDVDETAADNCIKLAETNNTTEDKEKCVEEKMMEHSNDDENKTNEDNVSKTSSVETQQASQHDEAPKSVETPMETEEKSSVSGNKSDSESGEDCASDLERATDKNDEDSDKQPEIEELNEIHLQICNKEEVQLCFICRKRKLAKFSFTRMSEEVKEYVCTDACFDMLEKHCTSVQSASYFSKKLPVVEEVVVKFKRKCKQCLRDIVSDKGLCSWESMDFCREVCLYRYQLKFTKKCSECEKKVEYHQLGKYSVRFGSIIRQFCSGACLDARKKKIRLCSFCQLAMSSCALPIISLNQKFFCTLQCKDKFLQLTTPLKSPYIPDRENAFCFICSDNSKDLTKEFIYRDTSYYFCGDECLTVFRLLHNFGSTSGKCHNCWKYAMLNQLEPHGMYYDGTFNLFCSKTCQFIHIIAHRRIMPCVWCKVKKYNFDLIRSGLLGEVVYGCSLNCFNQLQAALNKVANKSRVCEHCSEERITCEITMKNGSLKAFCSTKCVAEYQTKCRKLESRNENPDQLPQISSVCSLATQTNEKTLIFIQDEMLPDIANKMIQVRTMTSDQGTQILREKDEQECQTDFEEELRLRAVPVPIFVPQPMHMWNVPQPRAVPFPLPVPVPILMPLTRDASTEYLKTMKKEPVQTPRDPFESELLMMAELVAAEKPKEEIEEPEESVEDFSPEPTDTSFNDDVLQMALKMASDYQESAVDLEGALQANTITPGHHPMELTSSEEIIHTEPLTGVMRGGARGRGRGRGSRGPRGSTSSRRGRGRPPAMPTAPMPEPTPPPPTEPVEKPDAHMCLKYTFGVNAWKQWVTTKNSDLERSSRKLKLFKTDLLQMTADELNYSLCLFVNEVRKPNGSEYAPDTIYYLCLGIQQYLYECGRIDNIFCDSYYDKFTDCLDDVCGKFSSLYSDSHYIVTRVEEEHLWESKQLGAHSPFVLLTTLMFFNTKHFNLTSVEEHMQLSFSHIMKHWKRNPGQGTSRQMPVGGRNVLLRFYPPQNAQANTRKKKVYEQQENEDNPLRCPVKLYEFYLSKCPESVKTRNDVFYLLPERSCVPESPVWYSTMALDLKALNKMLHRVKMVKEINVALLTH